MMPILRIDLRVGAEPKKTKGLRSSCITPCKRIGLLLSIVLLFLPAAAVAQIAPQIVALARYQEQHFTFGGSTSVAWWVEPTWMGSVTPTGLYTAPSLGGTALVFAQAAGGPVYAASIFLNGQAAAPVSSAPALTPTP